MSNLLYYPYINVPRTDWTLTLLYYNNISSIVPQEYFYEAKRNYDDFMLELVRNVVNPIEILDNPWEVIRLFIELVERNRTRLSTLQNSFRQGHHGNMHIDKFLKANIHADKFDENVFYALGQLGLAERNEGRWYCVEQKTANNLMSYLASVISAKTNRLFTTDYVRLTFSRRTRKKRNYFNKLNSIS